MTTPAMPPPMPGYAASRVYRNRRTDAEIYLVKSHIVDILQADQPMSLRGLFYRLCARGVIDKTEAEYEKTGRYLLQLRRSGVVPYDWIADGTRWMRKPTTYRGIEGALAHTVATYRRAIWPAQGAYVEVWIEKEALAGVIAQETVAWDVPLMVSRGFSSETYLHSAAAAIDAQAAPAYIYLLTDYDPSGVVIAAHIERGLRRMCRRADALTVERLGVTPEQIAAWQLPSRPTKTGDSRSKGFGAESVDLDAIPPGQLRAIVREAIERHIDPEQLAATQHIEELERNQLYDLMQNWEF